jgi:predicted HicB family RNase H-like nuclease
MTNDLSYYLSLNYPIEIIQIPESEGGGFSASVPLLGRLACVGDGETVQEAIEDLTRVKERVLKELLQNGENIPVPEDEDDASYSGRILLRLPRELHKRISKKAEGRGESINRYIVNSLEADARVRVDEIYTAIAQIQTVIDLLSTRMDYAAFSGLVMPQYFGEIALTKGSPSQSNRATAAEKVPENEKKLRLVV